MTEQQTQHVVIADDVRPYRELLGKWFLEWGFTCTLAARGREAWQAIQENTVDLVVTDIDMPDVSGLELIRAIRASDCVRERSIPVIAISSLQDDEIDVITQQVGAIRFIPKPLDKKHLHATIAAVMASTQNYQHESPKTFTTQDEDSTVSVISPRLRRMLQGSDKSLRKKRNKE